jgi:hypothetical protein
MADQARTGTVHGVSGDYLAYVVPADHPEPDALGARLKELGYSRRGGRSVSVEGMPGAQVWVKLTPAAKAQRAKAKAAKADEGNDG